jgi:hypothetical protein
MIFIYVSELHEEAPMDNEQHWKIRKQFTGSPTLIYTTSGRKFKSSEEEIQKGISLSCRQGETYP